MYAKHYENPTMLSRVTAKNVGDVFFETHCTTSISYSSNILDKLSSAANTQVRKLSLEKSVITEYTGY